MLAVVVGGGWGVGLREDGEEDEVAVLHLRRVMAQEGELLLVAGVKVGGGEDEEDAGLVDERGEDLSLDWRKHGKEERECDEGTGHEGYRFVDFLKELTFFSMRSSTRCGGRLRGCLRRLPRAGCG